MHLSQIETARLRLRPVTLDDLDDLHRLWTDPDVRRYLWDDVVITRERAAEEIRRSLASFETQGFGQWAVSLKDKRSLIGFCGLRTVGDPLEIEILYGIAPAHWGQGLATEAARALLRYGFEEHGFERILAGADPPNVASFRVMEKAGMTFAQRVRVNDADAVYYAVAREAFQPDDALYRVRRA